MNERHYRIAISIYFRKDVKAFRRHLPTRFRPEVLASVLPKSWSALLHAISLRQSENVRNNKSGTRSATTSTHTPSCSCQLVRVRAAKYHRDLSLIRFPARAAVERAAHHNNSQESTQRTRSTSTRVHRAYRRAVRREHAYRREISPLVERSASTR